MWLSVAVQVFLKPESKEMKPKCDEFDFSLNKIITKAKWSMQDNFR